MSLTQAEIDFKCKVTETPTLGQDGTTAQPLTYQISTDVSSFTLSPSSVSPLPPGVYRYEKSITLSAGAATIDMSALDQGNLPDVDWTALSVTVQLIKVVAARANTANVVVADGATNGYNIFGDASAQISVPPGGVGMFYGHDGLQAVAAADKTIDLSSSDVDAVVSVQLIAG